MSLSEKTTQATENIPGSDRVETQAAVAYAAGAIPANVTDHAISFLANPIYNVLLGLSPVLVGNLQLLSRILSMVVDPVVAQFSDTLKSRFGRRHPFIVAGAVGVALCCLAFFFYPTGWGHDALGWYFASVCLLFSVFVTIFSTAYNSLLPELTADGGERARVLGYQLQLRTVATFATIWSLPFAQSALFSNVRMGLGFFGVLLAGLTVAAAGLIVWKVPEKFQAINLRQKTITFTLAFRESLKVKPLYPLLLSKLMLAVAGNLVNGLGFYLLVYYAGEGSLEKGALWSGTTGTAWLVAVMLLATPGVALCSRLGRRVGYSICCAVMIIAALLKPICIRPGTGLEILLPALLMGPAWSVANLIMQAQAVDITDYYELQTGRRQEAIAMITLGWVDKFLFPLSAAASGYLLVGLGFRLELGAHQLPGTFDRIMFCFVAIPVVFTLFSALLMFYYPLTEKKMKEVRSTLEVRRAVAERTRAATS